MKKINLIMALTLTFFASVLIPKSYAPVSFDIKDPGGNRKPPEVPANEATDLSKTYVEVGGNVEVIVPEDASKSFKLDCSGNECPPISPATSEEDETDEGNENP